MEYHHSKATGWSNRRPAMVLIIAALLFYCPFCLGQEEPVKVFQMVSPSVVGLTNPEGSGTGLILNRDGYILTNAHVVASPLPYQCNVEVNEGDKKKSVSFKRVKIIAVHPLRDLAIAKIDPKEHKVELVPAVVSKKKAVQGQKAYAIGNPGAGGKILNKSISVGLISGVDREIDKVKYYQVDAAINPGNSGGPLANKDGEILGLVTLKFMGVENVGFVTPFYDLSVADFEKVGKIKPKKDVSQHYVKQGMMHHSEAMKIAESRGKGSSAAQYEFFQSANAFRQAIRFDPQNPKIYASYGTALRLSGEDEISEVYLKFCLQIDPWIYDNGQVYNQLGLALSRQKKHTEATLCWTEGTKKAPEDAVRCWMNLSVAHFKKQDWVQSIQCARVADFLGGPEADPRKISKLISEAQKNLNAKEKERVEEDENKIETKIANMVAEMKSARKRKQSFLLESVKKYIESGGRYSAPQKEELPEFPLASASGTGKAKSGGFPIRTWTDKSGKYKVDAKLVSADGGQVVLRKKNGAVLMLPIERLSDKDRAYVQQQLPANK